jgi:hypothetical protein
MALLVGGCSSNAARYRLCTAWSDRYGHLNKKASFDRSLRKTLRVRCDRMAEERILCTIIGNCNCQS